MVQCIYHLPEDSDPAMPGPAPQLTNTVAELSTGCSPIESSKLFLSDEVHSNPLIMSSVFFHSSCFAIKWVPWWRQLWEMQSMDEMMR